MRSEDVTTPFGRRPMTLALVKNQLQVSKPCPGRKVDKWQVFRDVCAARKLLDIQDRPLAVLNALLTFFPENELAEGEALVVFPSNAQLSARANGISGSTLRRSLAVLVEAGLVLRRDSPNGKRYAHRDRGGRIEDAFGFSLAPLLRRAGEFARAAQQVEVEARQFRRLREALTICRRDVRKMLDAAMQTDAANDWNILDDRYAALVRCFPRSPVRHEVELLLAQMDALRRDVLNRLEMLIVARDMTANDNQDDCRKQNSDTESIRESELAPEKMEKARSPAIVRQDLSLSLVLRACPQIVDYAADGVVSGWRDLMTAAVVVRSTLGVSPAAYQEACEAMGAENAAVTMACILERAGHIHSAGGYLRDLASKARRGGFSPGPMLMALLKQGGSSDRLRA